MRLSRCVLYSTWLSVAMAIWRGRGLLHLTVHSPSLRTSRQELKAGSWKQGLKHRPQRNSAHWLALHDLLSLLLCITQDSLPRGGTTHSEWGPPTSINNQENAPHLCPHANLKEGIPPLRLPPLSDSSLCQVDL